MHEVTSLDAAVTGNWGSRPWGVSSIFLPSDFRDLRENFQDLFNPSSSPAQFWGETEVVLRPTRSVAKCSEVFLRNLLVWDMKWCTT